MPEKSFTTEEARTIGEAIGIDWSAAAYVHTRSPILVTMRVGAVMHRGVIRCGPDCSGLARIVTDAEIASALYDGTLGTSSAAEIAKSAAIVVRDDTLSHATRCMHEHDTTHAVVVDGRRLQRAVGVLSILDIVEVFAGGGR
jgi:CBS domain-containing protein